ncbi:MAG: ABC transporter permease [Bacillota bacterium]|jgi:ribose transport system permease protein
MRVNVGGFKINNANFNWKAIVNQLGALLGLLLLMIGLTIATPYFLTMRNLMIIIQQSAIIVLVASGMLLAILSAGIDLSVGATLALAICLIGIFIKSFGINPIIAVLLGIIIGTFLGMLNGLMLTRLHLPHPFIATLGTMSIYRGLALIFTGASPISGFPQWIQFLGAGYIGPIPFSMILIIFTVVIFHFFLTRTALGRHIYAVGGNLEAARLSGINTDKVLIWIYAISGLMATLGGLVLMGRVNAVYPLAGLQYEMDAISAVIIGGASFMGGVGTIWGTLIGAFIITIIRNGLNILGIASDMQTVIIGLVIVFAVYIDVLRRRKQQ